MSPSSAPAFQIEEIRFFERDVSLRLPFRFGAATVTACPQVFAQVRIRLADGSTSQGGAAEMMVPKWFDKNPALTHEENFEQLRTALRLARGAYLADRSAATGWTHFTRHYAAVLAAGAARGLQPLVAAYGPALIDRALFDALCLAADLAFPAALQTNLAGVDFAAAAELLPDLAGFDAAHFLATRTPRGRIAARHTVGLADAVTEAQRPADAPHDGLPASLEAAVARYGHTHFKLKVSGDVAADLDRLAAIAAVIDPCAELVTLDGNEQYADAQAFSDFLDQLLAAAPLRQLVRRMAFVEQPIRRDAALAQDASALARRVPLLIDESDATLDAFPRAQALGYTGVSSKCCKNFYKSIVNAARCAQAGGGQLFLSGEDLTMQAGVGVQQDLALVDCLGLTHVERNGHHYVNGMAALPAEEQQAFLTAHPGLYERSDGAVRLAIRGGQLDLSSLTTQGGPGFATGRKGAGISWDAMRASY